MQVVDFVINGGHDCVAGNHEQMMCDWKYGDYADMLWLGNGGDACLDSYRESDHPYLKGDVNVEKFEQHREWMKQLPIILEYPSILTPDGRHLVVSHSVCHNYYKALKAENEAKKIDAEKRVPWNRSFHKIKDAGFFNVIGHTPEEDNPRIRKIYANIDTGCFVGHDGWKRFKKGGLGKLTGLHVETMIIYQQECID